MTDIKLEEADVPRNMASQKNDDMSITETIQKAKKHVEQQDDKQLPTESIAQQEIEDNSNIQTLKKAKNVQYEQQQDVIQTLQNQENTQTDLLQKSQDASITKTLQKANKNEKQQIMEANILLNLQQQNLGTSNEETLKKAKKNEKQQIELEIPKQDLVQIKQCVGYGKTKQKIIVDKAAVLDKICQEQEKYQTSSQKILDTCSDKPFLLSSNEKNDESFMKFAALEVFQRANKLKEASEKQQRPIKEWQDKIQEIGVPLVYSGTTVQKELARIPNETASMCGDAIYMLKKFVEEAKANRKQTATKLVCSQNPKVQQIQKIALFSSKFVRPYLQDSTQAPQPTSKIELISSQIPMTTTLRAIMSNSFSIECLKQSRLDYMKPMLKMITTQFGLLDQKLEKKLMAFFCFCYSYFMGGAAEAVNDLLIFKKIQQHHRFSTKVINPPPKLTPETKAEVEDYLIRLINTPEVSLYSLGEDLGVGRILNYCSICGLMGMDPVILNGEDEEVVQQTLKNIIIKTEDQLFYQEKQVFQFLLNPISSLDCGGSEVDFELMWTYDTKEVFESPLENNEKKLKESNVKFSAVFEQVHKIKNEITSVGELRKAQECKSQNECKEIQTIYTEEFKVNTIATLAVKQSDFRVESLEKLGIQNKIMQLKYASLLNHLKQKKEQSMKQLAKDTEFVKKSIQTHQDQLKQQQQVAASQLKQFLVTKNNIKQILLKQKTQLEHYLQMKGQQCVNNKEQRQKTLLQKCVDFQDFMNSIIKSVPQLNIRCVDLKKQKQIAMISLAREVCDHYQGQLVEKAEAQIEEKKKRSQHILLQENQLSSSIEDIRTRYDEVQKKITQAGEQHVKQKQYFQLIAQKIIQKEEDDKQRLIMPSVNSMQEVRHENSDFIDPFDTSNAANNVNVNQPGPTSDQQPTNNVVHDEQPIDNTNANINVNAQHETQKVVAQNDTTQFSYFVNIDVANEPKNKNQKPTYLLQLERAHCQLEVALKRMKLFSLISQKVSRKIELTEHEAKLARKIKVKDKDTIQKEHNRQVAIRIDKLEAYALNSHNRVCLMQQTFIARYCSKDTQIQCEFQQEGLQKEFLHYDSEEQQFKFNRIQIQKQNILTRGKLVKAQKQLISETRDKTMFQQYYSKLTEFETLMQKKKEQLQQIDDRKKAIEAEEAEKKRIEDLRRKREEETLRKKSNYGKNRYNNYQQQNYVQQQVSQAKEKPQPQKEQQKDEPIEIFIDNHQKENIKEDINIIIDEQKKDQKEDINITVEEKKEEAIEITIDPEQPKNITQPPSNNVQKKYVKNEYKNQKYQDNKPQQTRYEGQKVSRQYQNKKKQQEVNIKMPPEDVVSEEGEDLMIEIGDKTVYMGTVWKKDGQKEE